MDGHLVKLRHHVAKLTCGLETRVAGGAGGLVAQTLFRADVAADFHMADLLAASVLEIADTHVHGAPVGHGVVQLVGAAAQLFNAAARGIADIAALGGAVLAEILLDGNAHGVEGRGIAEGPAHVHVRDGDGVGDGIENTFVPVGLTGAGLLQLFHCPGKVPVGEGRERLLVLRGGLGKGADGVRAASVPVGKQEGGDGKKRRKDQQQGQPGSEQAAAEGEQHKQGANERVTQRGFHSSSFVYRRSCAGAVCRGPAPESEARRFAERAALSIFRQPVVSRNKRGFSARFGPGALCRRLAFYLFRGETLLRPLPRVSRTETGSFPAGTVLPDIAVFLLNVRPAFANSSQNGHQARDRRKRSQSSLVMGRLNR